MKTFYTVIHSGKFYFVGKRVNSVWEKVGDPYIDYKECQREVLRLQEGR